ncbi:MAG: site-specific integrase [Oscillospiraceae bacterium]
MVRGVHTLLHNCLEQAVAERLILVNPAQGCKLPQLEKKEMKILPQEKIGMYLAEAERRGLLAAFYLELTTGLRRGELLALQWADLDVESKTLSVTKQVNRINGELVVSPPKTRNSVRTLALPQQAVDLLIAEHKKHSRNPYLFPSPKTGTMYDPDAFRRTHDKILKAIGTEHIRFHDLRHTFATLSLKSGVDVKTLSGALGHYSAGFTLEHLHPRHGPDEAGRSGRHRRGHQPADAITALKRQGQTGKILSGPVRHFPRLSPCGSVCES